MTLEPLDLNKLYFELDSARSVVENIKTSLRVISSKRPEPGALWHRRKAKTTPLDFARGDSRRLLSPRSNRFGCN